MTEDAYTTTPHTDTPHTDAPHTSSPTAAPRPPLQRSRTDLLLGGVSGGLARHTGIDTLLWRVGFVALTLAGGAGVGLYLVLWVLMPAAPADPATRTNLLDEWVEALRARFAPRRTSSAAVPR
jgi:phage shock protein PspC (stress-responsive transcriptional regulator)